MALLPNAGDPQAIMTDNMLHRTRIRKAWILEKPLAARAQEEWRDAVDKVGLVRRGRFAVGITSVGLSEGGDEDG